MMEDIERIETALKRGQLVLVSTQDEGNWVFRTDYDGCLCAKRQDGDSVVRFGTAATQRLRGWLAQVGSDYEIQPQTS